MDSFAHHQSPSLASRLLRWFSDVWVSATETDVIGQLDDRTLQELACDCSASADQLKQLTNAGPHAADEMVALMLAINIDPAEVARLYPQRFRDMQVNCSLCGSKERCRRDLYEQVIAREYVRYCCNANHLTALQKDAPLLMA
ncbi:hypothetical protein ABID21_004851 [Pseudorhizobium tarimense]|uniref:TniQ protein n=1 Tax=Pseudorhizobium tarimense TaxID=1079109 RepID=A0ABV2HDU0_9HYPH|nr:hypothetical protein [Pseudorhizobium tarimense]MCJ8521702.1 hypothetical protein [Pseudorhizobium tarimense]